MENRVLFLESVTTNINLLKKLNEKRKSDERYPKLTGTYATDIKLVLEDYVNVKESFLNLLAASGQDNDRITTLTVENVRLVQEKNALIDDKLKLLAILDEIYDIVHN